MKRKLLYKISKLILLFGHDSLTIISTQETFNDFWEILERTNLNFSKIFFSVPLVNHHRWSKIRLDLQLHDGVSHQYVLETLNLIKHIAMYVVLRKHLFAIWVMNKCMDLAKRPISRLQKVPHTIHWGGVAWEATWKAAYFW